MLQIISNLTYKPVFAQTQDVPENDFYRICNRPGAFIMSVQFQNAMEGMSVSH